ncbi:oligopeptide ABC transporter [Halalkalibacter hemicellulosilyticusJCM 9152]|uniref:Oligopeptide ABC transporter n=1 Tax=Halalkalibacter hemicellulosilyticusJCM 9152 TaxID=1236971 RepID=W4QBJ9_9BACI|nr:oligopeptide ABC transporter [Halalkalibacter hemicellulosilyticusJCM 9152]
MSMLTVKNVKKTYKDGHPAVNNVSFELKKGECLGLVGESGCGKSTLARCILRVESIDSGAIYFKEQAIEQLNERQLRPFRKNIQIVLQNPTAALNPKLKIKDSLLDPYIQYQNELTLTHFSYSSKDAFVKQLLEAVSLPASIQSLSS